MNMRPHAVAGSALAVVLATLALSGCATAQCQNITGTLRVWNGWPPPLRIEASDGVVYGVPEEMGGDNQVPAALLERIKSGETAIAGTYTVCPVGKTAWVPYDEREILLVSISAYEK